MPVQGDLMEPLIPSVSVSCFEEVASHLNGKEKIIVNGRGGVRDLIERAEFLKGGMFDFDGTLHKDNTWTVLGQRLAPGSQARDAAIRDWYWEQLHGQCDHRTTLFDPHWFIGRMDPRNQAVVDGAWIANYIQWCLQAGITRSDIRAVASKLCEREGASELLLMMKQRVVITFGIEQVVQDWLLERKIIAAVAGTRLTFDKEGLLTGHHPNIVAAPTKKLAADRFREITGLKEEEILVVGDSIVDVHMMHPEGFNVLLIPPSESEKKLRDSRENNLASMWNNLSMILVSDRLMPLVDLIMHERL